MRAFHLSSSWALPPTGSFPLSAVLVAVAVIKPVGDGCTAEDTVNCAILGGSVADKKEVRSTEERVS